ncbi:hypothetical protein CY35_01G013100 [Sphagnum magellanicum]|nr:hypothetical protein CY35_01G013100 [Sphagnum magellanicum]
MAPAAAERPSLLELCIRTACENVAHIGDVGSLPTQFVSRILQSCSGADQLRHIEVSSKRSDLVTDELWRGWFANDFGTTCAEYIMHTGERLGPANPTPKWRRLYDEKQIRSQSNRRPPPPPPPPPVLGVGNKRRRNSKDKNMVVEELRVSSVHRSHLPATAAAAAAGASSSSSKRQKRVGNLVNRATTKYKRRQERLRKATAKRAPARARG